MDLANHFTEIQIRDIFPLPFVDKVVKDVCSFQFAESEGLRRRFKKIMDRRFLVDLAVTQLEFYFEAYFSSIFMRTQM